MNEPLFVIPLWADLSAVALGGLQGALFASGFRGQRRLDLLGVAIIGIVMGMGGGLIRDLLLNVTPSTLQSNWYLLTAVAAALRHPERTVVAVAGDGDFLMNGQELATAAQHGADLIVIVVDNSAYGTIRMHQEREFPGEERISGTRLANPDFAALGGAINLTAG